MAGIGDVSLLQIVLIVIAAMTISTIATFNGVIHSYNRCREAWSGVEIQLQRRTSLVPNLVEIVRSYAEHEREVFEALTEAQGRLVESTGPSARADANSTLTSVLNHLLAIARTYPQLRASEQFSQLQDELFDIEEKLSYARQFYNEAVLEYNNRIQSFPGVLFADWCGFSPKEFFERGDAGFEAHVRLGPKIGAATEKSSRG